MRLVLEISTPRRGHLAVVNRGSLIVPNDRTHQIVKNGVTLGATEIDRAHQFSRQKTALRALSHESVSLFSIFWLRKYIFVSLE